MNAECDTLHKHFIIDSTFEFVVIDLKIVGIVGSPRKDGNTETITRIALEEIEKAGVKTELIRLAGKKIEPCSACGACQKGKCPIKDDFESIYRKMIRANGIVLSTPVYFGAATPQISNLISMSQQASYLLQSRLNQQLNSMGISGSAFDSIF